MNTYKYLLHHLYYYKSDICQFILKPTHDAIAIEAGQYVLFHLPCGINAPFSIAGFQHHHLEFHVRINEANIFIQEFLTHLQQVESIEISGPYGKCVLPQNKHIPLIFAAGGTGIAPHKALIDEALKSNYASIRLYWGIKTLNDLYLKSWLQRCESFENFQATVVLSEVPEDGLFERGLVHHYVLQEPKLSQGVLYASGPFAMIKALQLGSQQLGLKNIHVKSDMLNFNSDEPTS
ncbi:MAG TPA: hypothetical protein VFP93_04860 [Gammaproteobacteria bacterium]|nr:hypothetical protein [Gammaproteobacteria bacterium]